jgi:hypothetical protein
MHLSLLPLKPTGSRMRLSRAPPLFDQSSEPREHERKGIPDERLDVLDERLDIVEVPNRRYDARHGRVDVQAENEGERELHERVDGGGEQAERVLDLGKDAIEDV